MGIFTSLARRRQRWCAAVLLAFSLCWSARAEVIFDVFVGYGLGASDGVVAQGAWFPVTCEVYNNGPGFNALVEIQGGQFGNGARRVVPLELPSGTRKRFVVPVFCPSRNSIAVDAWLKNEKGRIIAEHRNLQPRPNNGHVDALSPLVAAIPKKHGAIILPERSPKSGQLSPAVTHLNAETFPESPLALEGIDTLYLHSSKALDLKAPQYTALVAWLHGGGRLVLAVEQPGDVKSTEWLQGILPCELGGVVTNSQTSRLQEWLTSTPERLATASHLSSGTDPFSSLRTDSAFESSSMPVTEAKLRDGRALVGSSDAPLMVSAPRGRGELVVLLFSPELAPFNSWANRNWFWARLAEIPPQWFNGTTVNSGMNSLDGVFGAMVDSRQIRKLPIGWLLLLLIVYLVVIGPLDQLWLKKINRQMLTWLTFPAYVVIFSALIYFIGYSLRSGESEWNELQIVDVVPHGARADLRGRTFAAGYAPVNATYSLSSDQPFATFRGEVASAGGEQAEREDVIEQRGNSFSARIAVPVWTSQLYVNDWWRQDTAPITLTVKEQGSDYHVEIQNPGNRRISAAKLVVGSQVYDIGSIDGSRTARFSRRSGQPLDQLVRSQQNLFNSVVAQRRRQFGNQYGGRIDDILTGATAASFLQLPGVRDEQQNQNNNSYGGYYTTFVPPRGFDLSRDLRDGAAVLIAHLPNETFATPLNKFSPRLSRKNSVLRVITPVNR